MDGTDRHIEVTLLPSPHFQRSDGVKKSGRGWEKLPTPLSVVCTYQKSYFPWWKWVEYSAQKDWNYQVLVWVLIFKHFAFFEEKNIFVKKTMLGLVVIPNLTLKLTIKIRNLLLLWRIWHFPGATWPIPKRDRLSGCGCDVNGASSYQRTGTPPSFYCAINLKIHTCIMYSTCL